MKLTLIVILIILFIFSLVTGCKKEDTEGQLEIRDTENQSNKLSEESSKILMVYFDYGIPRAFFRILVNDFKSLHPNVEIVEYDPTDGGKVSDNDAAIKLNIDILAGKGPDIIFSSGNGLNNKAITSGSFVDLNQLIEEDTTFNINEYDKAIMDAGVFGGKRVILPCLYYTLNLMTTNERMSELGIPLTKLSSPEGVLDAFEIAAERGQLTYFQISCMSEWSWFESIIDYENSTIDRENVYLRRVVELMKAIKNRDNLPYVIKDNSKEAFDEIYETEAFFIIPDLPFMVAYYDAHDAECETVEIPNDFSGTTATISMFSAINQNSKNKDLAWDFLKCTLSKSFQSNYYIHFPGLPVLSSIQEETYSFLCRYYSNGDTEYKNEMSSHFLESRRPITNAITAFELNDISTLLGRFEPYINDEKSYEECLAEILNYYSIYLSE